MLLVIVLTHARSGVGSVSIYDFFRLTLRNDKSYFKFSVSQYVQIFLHHLLTFVVISFIFFNIITFMKLASIYEWLLCTGITYTKSFIVCCFC